MTYDKRFWYTFLGFIIVLTVSQFATIPLHEGVHWALSTLDPNFTVTEVVLFNPNLLVDGYGGYVIAKSAYPEQTIFWIHLLQEIMAYGSQFLVTLIVLHIYLRKTNFY